METALRAALIAWLKSDPALSGSINQFAEEGPLETSPPWLGIVASASADWSVKGRAGREIRIALELHDRGDNIATSATLVTAIDKRVESLPRLQPDFELVTTTFLRARAEKRPRNTRAALLEYRFRALAPELIP